jgi:selenocysteine lyase/cysteine desulfurase
MKQDIANEFNLSDDIIYLNHAGVSPWPSRTSKAVIEFAEENSRMGSSRYLHWLDIEENVKELAKTLINAPSKNDIALVKNTSEALSIVAYGLDWEPGDNIVSSDQEFPSNRIVWESLAPQGVEFRQADLDSADSPEDAIFSLADSRTRLITISSIQFATGLKMNLKKIGGFCKSRGILFCIDAIQSLGASSFDVQKIQADFVMADAHKWMLGPEGIALFYTHPEARGILKLKQYGWHMVKSVGDFDRTEWEITETARRFECGSVNMLGIHALNASLSLLLETGMDAVESEIIKRSEYLFKLVRSEEKFELITPSQADRFGGIVTFRRHGMDNNAIYDYLMKCNVICASRAGGIRLSPHFYTPYNQLDSAIAMVSNYQSAN